MYVGHSTATVHFPQLFYRVEIVPFESFTATCLSLGGLQHFYGPDKHFLLVGFHFPWIGAA